MQEAQRIADELRAKRDNLHTNDDVSFVLGYIAPPSQKRDLKKQVIDLLFTAKSPQGYKTSDALSYFEEY